MPGPLYHLSNNTQCIHGGKVIDGPAGPRVFVNGDPVATTADLFTIAGCTFSTPAGPHPCVTVSWLSPALRIKINGLPALLQDSQGMTQAADLAPQGTPLVTVNQPRVIGT
jgi:uncharacterized Zn-binding protein involved in type VI secretion